MVVKLNIFMYYSPPQFLACSPAAFKLKACILNQSGKQYNRDGSRILWKGVQIYKTGVQPDYLLIVPDFSENSPWLS